MTCTGKNLQIVCVKIGHMLATDFANIILHHLKQICINFYV